MGNAIHAGMKSVLTEDQFVDKFNSLKTTLEKGGKVKTSLEGKELAKTVMGRFKSRMIRILKECLSKLTGKDRLAYVRTGNVAKETLKGCRNYRQTVKRFLTADEINVVVLFLTHLNKGSRSDQEKATVQKRIDKIKTELLEKKQPHERDHQKVQEAATQLIEAAKTQAKLEAEQILNAAKDKAQLIIGGALAQANSQPGAGQGTPPPPPSFGPPPPPPGPPPPPSTASTTLKIPKSPSTNTLLNNTPAETGTPPPPSAAALQGALGSLKKTSSQNLLKPGPQTQNSSTPKTPQQQLIEQLKNKVTSGNSSLPTPPSPSQTPKSPTTKQLSTKPPLTETEWIQKENERLAKELARRTNPKQNFYMDAPHLQFFDCKGSSFQKALDSLTNDELKIVLLLAKQHGKMPAEKQELFNKLVIDHQAITANKNWKLFEKFKSNWMLLFTDHKDHTAFVIIGKFLEKLQERVNQGKDKEYKAKPYKP